MALLDHHPNAAAGYSVEKIRNAYAGALVDSTSGPVGTWHDQSGNGQDLTASGAVRPEYSESGLIFDGVEEGFERSVSSSAAFTIALRAAPTGRNGPPQTIVDLDGIRIFEYDGLLYTDIQNDGGGGWSTLGSYPSSELNSLVAYGGNLYAGNRTAGEVAMYDGSSWSVLGSFPGDRAFTLCIYQGELYVGARQSGSGVYRWTGSSWVSIGYGGSGAPRALCVYDGDLYGASPSPDEVVRWDGSSWSVVSGYPGTSPFALCTYRGQLVTADFDSGSVSAYDGSSWTTLGSLPGSSPFGLSVFEGDLYVSHYNDNQIDRWDGSSWSVVGSWPGGHPHGLLAYDGRLYAPSSDDDAVYAWDGSSWSAVGSYPGARPDSLAVYDGRLAVGDFDPAAVNLWGGGASTFQAHGGGDLKIVVAVDGSDVVVRAGGNEASVSHSVSRSQNGTLDVAFAEGTTQSGWFSGNDGAYDGRIHTAVLWPTFKSQADRADIASALTGETPSRSVVSIRSQVSSRAAVPVQPSATGAVNVQSQQADLTSSAYSEPSGDPHVSSDWQVRGQGAANWSSPVFESINNTSALESITATGLSPDTTYEYRVRHGDEDGKSPWSSPATVFTDAVGAPVVETLTIMEVETSDPDAEFDVEWVVSDPDADLLRVEFQLYNLTEEREANAAEFSISGGSADHGANPYRFAAPGKDGSGDTFVIRMDVFDEANNATRGTAEITETNPVQPPAIDALTVTEVETESGDAEFDVSWQASDPNSNLDNVFLTLRDDTDGGAESQASIGVSGGSASGTTRLVATGDDGTGNSYTVQAEVVDADGQTDTQTASVTETEVTADPYLDPSITYAEAQNDWSGIGSDPNALVIQQEPRHHSIYGWLKGLTVPDVATNSYAAPTYSPGSGATNDEIYSAWVSLRNTGGEVPLPRLLRYPDEDFVLSDGSGNGFEAQPGFEGDPTVGADESQGATTIPVSTDAGESVDLQSGALIIFGTHLSRYEVVEDVTIPESSSGTITLTSGLDEQVPSGTSIFGAPQINLDGNQVRKAVTAQAGWWVDFNIPGLTNPYYDDDNARRKIMAQVCADLLELGRFVRNQGSVAHGATNLVGMALRDNIQAAAHAAGVLPDAVQYAVVEQAYWIFDQVQGSTNWPWINENMSSKGLCGLLVCWRLLDDLGMDAAQKDNIMSTVKDALYDDSAQGSSTPNDDSYGHHSNSLTDNPEIEGLARPTGGWIENGGHHGSYNGITMHYLLEGYGYVQYWPEWDFFREMTRRFFERGAHEAVPDYDGVTSGPTMYSNREMSPITGDQSPNAGKYMLAAQWFGEDAFPWFGTLRRGNNSNCVPPSVSDMESTIQDHLSNGISFSETGSRSRDWALESRWGPRDGGIGYLHYQIGTYDLINDAIQNDHPSLTVPMGRDGNTYSQIKGDFMRHKGIHNGREWSCLVEAALSPGMWTGGMQNLNSFWTKETGPIIHGIKSQAVYDPPKPRIRFDVSLSDGSSEGFHYYEQGETVPVDSRTRGSGWIEQEMTKGQIINRTRANILSGALEMVNEVRPSGSSFEWTTAVYELPIYRGRGSYVFDSGLGEYEGPRTLIEYWTGSGWQTLTTSEQQTQYIRLSRDLGGGRAYVYLVLDQQRTVRMRQSSDYHQFADWAPLSYRHRDLYVDVHPDPGNAQTVTGPETFIYTLQLDDPTA